MQSIFRRLWKNEQGATAIEYVLIASLIAVGAVAGFTAFGSELSGKLTNFSEGIKNLQDNK